MSSIEALPTTAMPSKLRRFAKMIVRPAVIRRPSLLLLQIFRSKNSAIAPLSPKHS